MRNTRGRLVEEAACRSCGKVFWPEVSEVRRGKGTTCSPSCAAKQCPPQDMAGVNNPNWRGGASLDGDKARERYRESKRRYVAKHPQKYAAHLAVRDALRSGHLRRKCCQECGDPRAEAHHDDYEQKLNVRWLCRTHHRAHHMKEREDGREVYAARK